MTAHCHAPRGPVRVGFGILTISDTRTPETDDGGSLAVSLIEAAGHAASWRDLCRDEPDRLRALLAEATARDDVDVIVTTGGTGVAQRDRTFEAVSALHEVALPGFGELFRALSFQEIGAAAMLSRATAGVIAGRPVFSVPGAPPAVRLALERLILPEVTHLVAQVGRRGKRGA